MTAKEIRQLETQDVNEEEEDKIYMDYNATTPIAESVIEIIQEALKKCWGNPSSSYTSGIRAKEVIDTARSQILQMVNGSTLSEITFMSGGTEANNHVIWNALEYFKEFQDNSCSLVTKPHIITSGIEHDSILNVLKKLQEEKQVDVTYIAVSKELGLVDPEDVLCEVRDETVLVTLMMANNETGVIQKVTEICKAIKQLQRENLPRILLHTDAAQTIGKIPVDVQDLQVDYMTIVGHKFYGPRIGALWVRDGCPIRPMLLGGGQESGKRAGTENTPMIAGLGEAARLVTEKLEADNQYFNKLRLQLIDALKKTFHEEIQINCDIQRNLPNTVNVSFLKSQRNGRQILANCLKLSASVGAACHTNLGQQASFILMAHHVPLHVAINAVRLSFGRHTTKMDINHIVQDLRKAVDTEI